MKNKYKIVELDPNLNPEITKNIKVTYKGVEINNISVAIFKLSERMKSNGELVKDLLKSGTHVEVYEEKDEPKEERK